VAGSCEYVNEPSVSVKYGEFLVLVTECGLLRNNSAAWSSLSLSPVFILVTLQWE
jgi:hypothetical protein